MVKKSNKTKRADRVTPAICPFLGMSGDSGTALGFPSAWNYCHHCAPAESVNLDHQKTSCLNGDYESCPAFLQSQNDALPPELRNVSLVRPVNRKVFWMVVLVILAMLAAAFLFSWKFQANNVPFSTILFPGTYSPAIPSPYVSQTSLPAAITTSTPPPSPIPNSTFGSGSRVTPIITRRPHGLGEWIGVNNIFIIYRVKQGWTFERLATYYNTTPAAIKAVNYRLTTPLFPGQLIVIPINQTDVSGLPQFEIYRVTEDISVEKLAIQLNVESDQLRTYNGFNPNELLMAREWILVPREQAETK